MGLHSSFLGLDDCCLPEEAFQVFLDENRVAPGSLGPPPVLPDRRGRKLMQIIRTAAPVFSQRPADWRDTRLPFFDSAFEMAVRPETADGSPTQGRESWGVDEAQLREGFLKFFVAIFMNYRRLGLC